MRRVRLGIALAAATATTAGGPLLAQAGRPPAHARVSLIAATTTLDPGARDMYVGVRFQIDDGWHIYWRNPGGSGTPPKVTWNGPGLSFDDIQWPTPTRYDLEGATIYGYEKSTVLLVPVRRAAGERLGGTITLEAKVDYVICNDICVRETASPALSLRVSSSPVASSEAALIDDARSRLPRAAPAGWTAAASLGTDGWSLRVTTGRSEPQAWFFPFEAGLIDEPAVERVEPDARGLTLHLKKSPYFSSAPAALSGVLVLPGRGAFTISAPLRR